MKRLNLEVSVWPLFLPLVNVLCLRHRVTFEVHLESVSWFQWLFGLWVDWTLDMRVFGFIDGLYHVKIALSILFFSVLVSICFPFPFDVETGLLSRLGT